MISLRDCRMYDMVVKEARECRMVARILECVLQSGAPESVNIFCVGGKQRSVAVAHCVHTELQERYADVVDSILVHGPARGIERESWKCDPRFRWRDATTGAFLSLQRSQEIEADFLSSENYGQVLRRDVFCVSTRGAGAFPYFWRDGIKYLVLGVEKRWIKWYSIPGGTYDRSDRDMRETAAREAWEELSGMFQSHEDILDILDEDESIFVNCWSFEIEERDLERFQKNKEYKALVTISEGEFARQLVENCDKKITINGREYTGTLAINGRELPFRASSWPRLR